MARHNNCDVLDIVKTGEVCSKQKNINEKFMHGLTNCLNSDSDGEVEVVKPSSGVLDLTAEEELTESGSYEEEEGEGPFDYDDNPTSADAYEIDGFVVEDHDDDKPQPAWKVINQEGPLKSTVSAMKNSSAQVRKRKLRAIPESDEE